MPMRPFPSPQWQESLDKVLAGQGLINRHEDVPAEMLQDANARQETPEGFYTRLLAEGRLSWVENEAAQPLVRHKKAWLLVLFASILAIAAALTPATTQHVISRRSGFLIGAGLVLLLGIGFFVIDHFRSAKRP